nr:M48 family metallopeptidase [uncultured Sanguibacteroides sp.]
MKKRFTRITLLSSFLLLMYQCATVPITGRHQLILFPEDQMVQTSLTSYSSFIKENKLSTNDSAKKLVREVGARISNAVEQYLRDHGLESEIENFKWEFNLVVSDEPNAWCMPGGKVVFYEGILPYCQNEAGIAVVMGHEIAHAVAHHSNERMSQQALIQYGSTAASELLGQSQGAARKVLLEQVIGIGTNVGIILPFSRKHESEADHLGLIFMTMAGYDPHEATAFWSRMAAAGGSKQAEFLSTHPADEKRIAQLKALIPEALKYKPQE